jgi:chromosome segregation ATPase
VVLSTELLINILLAVIGVLLVRLLSKLEDGNIKLTNIEIKIAELAITMKNYDKELQTLREWNHSQDKEILSLRERMHELSDKMQHKMRD